MNITRATHDDIPQLCELLEILFSQEAEFRPDLEKQTIGIKQIIDFPERGQILTLREGSHIIGMVNLLFIVSTALGGRVAILEDMIIRPGYRGRGAGTMLLRETIQFAKSAGCQRITLLTDQTNKSAQKFYKHHGFIISKMMPLRLILTE